MTVEIGANDESGIASMCLSATPTCTTFVPFAATTTFVTPVTGGTARVNVWLRDVNGNTMLSPTTDEIDIDVTRPIDGGNALATSTEFETTLTWGAAIEVGSGLAGYTVVHSTSAVPPAGCATGTVVHDGIERSLVVPRTPGQRDLFRICARDVAGNVSPGTASPFVSNGDFDNGVLAPWVVSHGNPASVRIVDRTLDFRDHDSVWHGVKQTIAVEPYATYRISLVAKSSNSDGYFGFRAANYGSILGERSIGRGLTDWTARSVDVYTAGSSSVDFYVGMWATAGPVVFLTVDDIVVTKVSNAPLVANGSFGSGALAPWTVSHGVAAAVTITPELALDIRDDDGVWHGVKQVVAVQANATYRLALKLKTGNCDAYFGLRAAGYGAILGEIKVGRDLADWTAQQIDVAVGNRTSVDLYVGVVAPSGTICGVTVDDVTLIKR